MYSLNSRKAHLFKKYYNKTASPAEIKELLLMLKEASDDELIVLMREEWENLQPEDRLFDSGKSIEMLNNILPEADILDEDIIEDKKEQWIYVLKRLSGTAAVMILVGIGIYFLRYENEKIGSEVAVIPVLNDVPPGGNKAILTLADGKQVILDSLKNGSILKTADFEINKSEDGQLVYHALDRNYENAVTTDLNMVSTPRGGEYKVILPDGSKVWLNAASSLKFPAVFRGNIREVELKGEAYFEVAKNEAMPFKVRSKHADIEVLGTHFNVRAYNDELSMKTTLVEGSVKVRTPNTINRLKPGEQAVLENNKVHIIDNIDVQEQIAWKNGLFQFKDASLEDVMKQAALWYDLKVSYTGEIPKKYFTGKTSRRVNASEFLNMLRYIGVEFKRQGKNVEISN